MVEDLRDERRVDPEPTGDERSMLEGWMDFQRTTLMLKCEGLSPEGLKSRPVPTSVLSLHGLVRHMADVERIWFTECLLRAPDTEPLFYVKGVNDDREMFPLDDADWESDLRTWKAECDISRTHAARFDLDDAGVRYDVEVSLRWIYMHMIEEYARHNGHADLIRELVDGAVGY